MIRSRYRSWTGLSEHTANVQVPWSKPTSADLAEDPTVLAYGNGRSYSDVCINNQGRLIDTRQLNRFGKFDIESGVLICESGVRLESILAVMIPRGWFLPVTPGTGKVTVGGAIANDVHGKNHHKMGSFGCHVEWLGLLRSDGSSRCSRQQCPDLFYATIGGLGLTGLITEVALRLKRVVGPYLVVERKRFSDLHEFFKLSEESSANFEYTVAWMDCFATGSSLGRGVFERANHLDTNSSLTFDTLIAFAPSIAISPPFSLVNRLTTRPFNALYYRHGAQHWRSEQCHFAKLLYPLDRIKHWNRIYGPKGFFQYQCLIPPQNAEAALTEMLTIVARERDGSPLIVAKTMGQQKSGGLMSFPDSGLTLALDFPNRGQRTLDLMAQLDDVVRNALGKLYAAKDIRIPSSLFKTSYPRWEEFIEYIDPNFSSDFWRRVGGQKCQAY